MLEVILERSEIMEFRLEWFYFYIVNSSKPFIETQVIH